MDENKEVKIEEAALAVKPEENRAIHGSEMKAEAPAAAVEPEVVEKKEDAAPAPAPAEEAKPQGKKLAGEGVFVQMSALVPNSRVKNSRSVTSVQARLIELGHAEAGDDKRGQFGENTLVALENFFKDSKVKAESCLEESVIVALFKGTAVEVVA